MFLYLLGEKNVPSQYGAGGKRSQPWRICFPGPGAYGNILGSLEIRKAEDLDPWQEGTKVGVKEDARGPGSYMVSMIRVAGQRFLRLLKHHKHSIFNKTYLLISRLHTTPVQGGGRAASFLNSQGESVPCFSQVVGVALVPGFFIRTLDIKGRIPTALRPSVYHSSFLLEEAGVLCSKSTGEETGLSWLLQDPCCFLRSEALSHLQSLLCFTHRM